jgi:hypothetical protein
MLAFVDCAMCIHQPPRVKKCEANLSGADKLTDATSIERRGLAGERSNLRGTQHAGAHSP